MKYIIVLVSAVLFCSCYGAQNAAESPVNAYNLPNVAPNDSDTVATPNTAEPIDPIDLTIPEPPKPPEFESVEKVSEHKPEVFDHSKWNTLLKRHVSENGNVNYKGFKTDRSELATYINALAQNRPNEDWRRDDILAYWINAYNALTIDLIIKNFPIKSIKAIKDPWHQRLWQFGDKWINLNGIEHDILRVMDEPRIHFAIVCASVSCPKLQNEAFTATDLEVQLSKATATFLNDRSRNEISKDLIILSKIFKWFSKDFERNGTVIDFLNTYSDIAISQSAKIEYKDYNWELNN